jgi:hypothetical protein
MLYFLSILAIGFIACEKNPVSEKHSDPITTSAFTRTIQYTNQGTIKEAVYDTTFPIENFATIEEDHIALAFIAAPKTPQSAGDAIAFQIDARHLSSLAKTYTFNDRENPISFARYTYTYQRADGSIWSSISDTKMGIQFEGFLTIEKYDAVRQLMSGTYKAAIKGLINDPTKNNVSAPIDPINQCDVTITGTFTNLKLQVE